MPIVQCTLPPRKVPPAHPLSPLVFIPLLVLLSQFFFRVLVSGLQVDGGEVIGKVDDKDENDDGEDEGVDSSIN